MVKSRLEQAILNDLHGVEVEVTRGLLSDYFILTHKSSDYPFCAIYQIEPKRYAVYQVEIEYLNGYEVDNETLILTGATCNQAVNAAKDLQKTLYASKVTGKCEDYPTILSTADGKNLQVEHHNQHGER